MIVCGAWTMTHRHLYYICKHKNILVRNGLLLLFILVFSGLQLYGQTDSAGNSASKVSNTTVKDTVTRKAPVKKKPLADTGRLAAKPKPAGAGTPAAKKTEAVPLPAADSLKSADTALQQQSVTLHKESAYDIFLRSLASKNMFLQANKPRYYDLNTLRPYKDLDWLVYLVTGIVLLLGIIRLAYLKYFSDLFRAFLNPTLSQRQLKDQLSQSPFPNFLLNAFFVVSLGVYLYLLMYRQQYIFNADAWLLIPGLVLMVAVIYMSKYLVLRFCGWLFGNSDLADAYIFILYLINKVLGILLVPFLVILAFCQPEIARAFLYISLFFIILLIGYRYVRSYSVVKQYLSFNKLHFFLYLCAFEVAPVLILTKVLLIWLTGNP
jgi:hypothetical protein